MILECNNCKTKFVISDDKIGESGRKVKCSKCSNVWVATKEDNVENKSLSRKYKIIEPEDIPSHSSLPAVINNSSNWMLGLLIPVMIMCITVGLIFAFPKQFSQWPGFSYVVTSLGYSDVEGLEISDIKVNKIATDKSPSKQGSKSEKNTTNNIEKNEENGENGENGEKSSKKEAEKSSAKFIIGIKIYNTNNSEKTVPSLRLHIFDNNNKKVLTKYMSPKAKTIEPFTYINVQAELESLPDKAGHLEVFLGNKLELVKL